MTKKKERNFYDNPKPHPSMATIRKRKLKNALKKKVKK